MRSFILGGLLASAMIVPALAQTSPPPASSAPVASSSTAQKLEGQAWRSSKLIGLNVYNEQNEKLGDISEILLDKSGKVQGVVIGVGGFLGIGQHDILVDIGKLKFVDEPVRSTTTSTTTTTGTGSPASSNRPATTTTASSDRKWYPDHAILSGASKDQLTSMPQFKY
jgi:sporulation protein YlmC with PRC-barrel domain